MCTFATARRAHSSACLCSIARLANVMVGCGDKRQHPDFWKNHALKCWVGERPYHVLQQQVDGLVEDVYNGEMRHMSYFASDPHFDDIRSNPPDDYRPTSERLRKKFDEYFDMFLALLRPTDATERYSAITDIRAEAALSSKFNLTDAKGKATWYLFCVLHYEGLLAPGNFGK